MKTVTIQPAELDGLFSVPFLRGRLDAPEELASLARALGLMRDMGGISLDYRVGFSNTGWHSPQWGAETLPTELTWLYEQFDLFLRAGMQRLLDANHAFAGKPLRTLETEFVMWSVINRPSDYNLRHVHTSRWRDTWSIVCYPFVPADIEGGEIRLFNPNLAYRCSQGTTLSRLGAELMYKKIAPDRKSVV